MNRIDTLFKRKKGDILSLYMTAGFPELEDTVKIIRLLESAGVDMIEIGMPFSDPLADGLVIQESSQRSLENGMSLKLLFEQLKDIRKSVDIPLVLMGYLNPVMQYGIKKFVSDCREIGIDGLIIPDLPLHEFRMDYKPLFDKSGIHMIMLITPQTTQERILEIAELSGGFLYVVADSSTTGVKSGIAEAQLSYFRRVEEMEISIPRLIGFGISDAETFQTACKYANGAIIGSAFIRSITGLKDSNIESAINRFVDSIR